MLQNTLSLTLILMASTAFASWAQPPGSTDYPGDEDSRFARGREDRLARMVEYLELSESQALDWQAILDNRAEAAPDRREMMQAIDEWREDFRLLAEDDSPDLERLGQLALNIHRAHETRRTSRDQLVDELATILTPEQAERFRALKAARDYAETRERRTPRHRRSSPDSN